MKKLLAIFAVITIALTGCSIKKDKRTADEMPSDKPWNKILMETENGYYYQANYYKMSLRYVEKSNGTNIYLCAKPECLHDGETTCTATYPFNYVSNYVLYNGFIYFAANESTEKTYCYTFYKAALDGSSLDKVSEIKRVKNNSDSEARGLIAGDICIHKGYAYIPYELGSSFTYAEFVETGFARVNILTEETEILFSHNDFMKGFHYSVVCGIGDYVYYIRNKNAQNVLCRYNIKNGVSEDITGELAKAISNEIGENTLEAVTENTFYVHYYDTLSANETITGYDINTFNKTDFELDLKDEYNSGYHTTMFYDNKIFVVRLDRIDVYSDTGELVGAHPIPSYFEENETITPTRGDFRKFDISNDKIYMEYVSQAQILDAGYYDGNWNIPSSMYSCSIEDVIAGKGKWEKQFSCGYI